MRVLFFLRNPKKKGRTAIYATIRYQGQRAIIFPGESIDSSMWINRKNMNKPKPIPENSALIGRLNRAEQLYRNIYDDLQSSIGGFVPPEKLKEAIYNKINPPEKMKDKTTTLITEFFNTLIEDSKSGHRTTPNRQKLNANSIKPYVSALNHFTEFQKRSKKKYYLHEFDQNLIDAFTRHLEVTQNLALNACAKYLTVFKLLATYAQQCHLMDINTLSALKFQIRKGKSDNIFLSEKQIDDLMKIKDFPTPTYEIVRNLFVIGCWSGLRFSDYSRLRLENINQETGYIEITQQKVDAKVVIPLHKSVRQILQMYPNGLPKCPPNQVFNRYLKEIGRKLPDLDVDFEKKIVRSNNAPPEVFKKWQCIQTHTARRSFCTNMYLKGVPVPTIMAISGHKTAENFLKYIKADNHRHAEILRKKFDEENDLGMPLLPTQ